MGEDNQTINLGNNTSFMNSSNSILSPIEDAIVTSKVNEPLSVDTLSQDVSSQVSPIKINQDNANLSAQAQVVTPSTSISGVSINTGSVLSGGSQTVLVDQDITEHVVTEQPTIVQATTAVLEEIQAADNGSIADSNTVIKQEGISMIQEKKFTMYDTFTVNTELFKTMIVNAKKAAICDNYLVYSTILDITFDNEFLKVVATDGDNVLVQVNKYIGFKDTLHFNVMADLFVNLVSKLDCETITFELNPENRYIRLITNDGSDFKIPEFYDRDSGQNVNLERQEGKIQPNDIEIDIDGVRFKQLIQSASMVTADVKLFEYLSGVFCTDKVYSTDADNMIGLPNLPQLADHSFYLSNKFVKLLLSLSFDTNSKIILRPTPEDNSVISHVILMDDNMILDGSCDLEFTASYPVETVRSFIYRSFDNKFLIEKSKLIGVLKVAELFIQSNTDKECCILSPNSSKSNLEVRSINKQAHQYIPVQGLNKELKEFYIKVKDLIKVLDICPSEFVNVEVNNEDYANIRITDQDFILITSIQNLQ